MSVMIYDTANGSFKDIQAMQRYDPSANAWTDCKSAKVQENDVWVEKWSPIKELIPIMTDNTSPYGVCTCHDSSKSAAYCVFDGRDDTYVDACYVENISLFVTYTFKSKVFLDHLSISWIPFTVNSSGYYDMVLQYRRSESSSWITVGTFSRALVNSKTPYTDISSIIKDEATSIKAYVSQTKTYGSDVRFYEMQAYGCYK